MSAKHFPRVNRIGSEPKKQILRDAARICKFRIRPKTRFPEISREMRSEIFETEVWHGLRSGIAALWRTRGLSSTLMSKDASMINLHTTSLDSESYEFGFSPLFAGGLLKLRRCSVSQHWLGGIS